MRTDQEIIDRINARKEADFFGFELTDLLIRLPFELAKPFLNPDVKGDDWKGTPKGQRLEAELAELGARIVYLPYTPSTSSSMLRGFLRADVPTRGPQESRVSA